jgi:hypothetical protein
VINRETRVRNGAIEERWFNVTSGCWTAWTIITPDHEEAIGS